MNIIEYTAITRPLRELGVIDWTRVLRAAESAGVKHYYVEQDQTPGDPLASLRQSYGYLSKLTY